MSLKQDIADWDAKDVDYINNLYSNNFHEAEFLDNLIGFLDDVPLQRGASWMIKHYVDEGSTLADQHVNEIISKCQKFDHWETKLHILQILPSVTIPSSLKQHVYEFLLDGVRSDVKFVRAWSYGGLIVLSEQDHSYRNMAEKLIKVALNNESASVLARIRQASKKSEHWKNVIS